MRLTALIVIVVAQFTIVPFINMVGHNKPAHFVVKNTIIYKE